jgi:transposase
MGDGGHDSAAAVVIPSSRPQNGRVMSMQPAPWPEPDPVVAAAFGVRGRPGLSPSVLALVTTLQRVENMTGRMAAEAVRTRLDLKYLLGLSLDDPGFDHSVLPEFRARVADAGLEAVPLDALLERLAAEGLVKAGGKQRTDSTHVVAAVAALNRLELAGPARQRGGPPVRHSADGLASPGLGEEAGRARGHLREGRVRAAGSRLRQEVPGLAGGTARGGRAAPGPAAELHPGHPCRRAGGDHAAGESACGRRRPARQNPDRLSL